MARFVPSVTAMLAVHACLGTLGSRLTLVQRLHVTIPRQDNGDIIVPRSGSSSGLSNEKRWLYAMEYSRYASEPSLVSVADFCKVSGMAGVVGDRIELFSRLGADENPHSCEGYARACISAVVMRGLDQWKSTNDLVR